MNKTITLLALALFAHGVTAAEQPHWAYPIVVEKPVAPGGGKIE